MAPPASTVLEALQAQNPNLPRALGVHVAVADTSALISDVRESVRHGLPSPLLVAMKIGVVRVMVAHHVWAEVPRNLASLGAHGRLDHLQAEELWWEQYVPLIRVVSTARTPTSDHDAILGRRDPTDLPTARLHGLISPAVALASDRDLIDLGLSADRWRLAADATGAMAEIGRAAFAGNFALNVGVEGAVASAHGLFKLLQHPLAPAALLAVGTGLTLSRAQWRPRLDARSDRVRHRIAEVWPVFEAYVVEFQERVTSAYERWDDAETGRAGQSPAHAVARLLATSPPLTRREIAQRLLPRASPTEHHRATTSLARTLVTCSAFVEIRRGRWQIGLAGADFGGVVRDVNPLPGSEAAAQVAPTPGPTGELL